MQVLAPRSFPVAPCAEGDAARLLRAALPDGLGGTGAVRSASHRRGAVCMLLEDRLAAGMAAAQRGDGAAYRAVLGESLPLIAAAARAAGVRGALVDDVVQETLLTLHHARHTYDPALPFLPWLRAIARRRAIDALRRQGRRVREVHDPVALDAHPDASGAPGDALDAADRRRVLRAAVASLPAGQREAVEHLSLAERSLDETAALTGRSKVALKVNLHRALKALRQRLAGQRERGDV